MVWLMRLGSHYNPSLEIQKSCINETKSPLKKLEKRANKKTLVLLKQTVSKK